MIATVSSPAKIPTTHPAPFEKGWVPQGYIGPVALPGTALAGPPPHLIAAVRPASLGTAAPSTCGRFPAARPYRWPLGRRRTAGTPVRLTARRSRSERESSARTVPA